MAMAGLIIGVSGLGAYTVSRWGRAIARGARLAERQGQAVVRPTRSP
jgi:hypothetical protein